METITEVYIEHISFLIQILKLTVNHKYFINKNTYEVYLYVSVYICIEYKYVFKHIIYMYNIYSIYDD